jgi:hypothetical protein
VTDPVTAGSPTSWCSLASDFGLFALTSMAAEKQHSISAVIHRNARRARVVRFDMRTSVQGQG